MNEMFRRMKQNFGDFDIEIKLAEFDEIDWWVTHPVKAFPSNNTCTSQDEENLSKFFNLQIYENNSKGNSEELLNECINIVSTQSLSENNKILFLKLLSSLSVTESAKNLIKSTELLKWVEQYSKSDSSKIFLESWKLLHNLKLNEENFCAYLDGIYSFTPPWETQNPVADIVLVHGIKGGAAWTWRQHDSRQNKAVLSQQQRQWLLNSSQEEEGGLSYQSLLNEAYTWIWPLDWLRHRIKHSVRIIAVDYQAEWRNSLGGEVDHQKDLNTLSEDLLVKLKAADVGSRPIIWIAHSMGGLVVKKMIEKEGCSLRGEPRGLLSSTRAFVFLSVPHFGSPLASWTCFLSSLLKPSPYIYHMRAGCPNLLKMHRVFVDFCTAESVPVLTLNETQPCRVSGGLRVTFVPPKYGNPGIGQYHEVDASHLDICKPKERSDEKFKIIEEFILEIFKTLPIS